VLFVNDRVVLSSFFHIVEADYKYRHIFLLEISIHALYLGSNGNLNLDASLDVDDDLLDNLGRGVEATLSSASVEPCPGYTSNLLNQTLVDSHLEAIPCLGTFTARSLASGDLKSLGWETDGALDTEVLGLGTVDEFLANLLEGLDLSAGQGDTDLVSLL
jgi:hypothetical protein